MAKLTSQTAVDLLHRHEGTETKTVKEATRWPCDVRKSDKWYKRNENLKIGRVATEHFRVQMRAARPLDSTGGMRQIRETQKKTMMKEKFGNG